MLSTIKTWPGSSSPRTVPYGGLGGCVELRNEPFKVEHNSTPDTSHRRVRRKPTSIDTQQRDPAYEYWSKPVSRSAGMPYVMPQSPIEARHLPTPKTAHLDGSGSSPFDLWEKCNNNPWLTAAPRQGLFTPKPVTRRRTLPVELPGSLLLPSQGFAQNNPPNTPPPSTKPSRTGDGLSHSTFSSPTPGLTYSGHSTPASPPQSRSTFSSPSHRRMPSAPVGSTNVPKPLSLLDVEQLLKILPSLDVREIVVKWMGTVERELTKFRGFSMSLSLDEPTQLMALRPFCDELEAILKQAHLMCERHSPEFRSAQESTDPNRQSDATKVTLSLDRLGGLSSSILSPNFVHNIRQDWLENVKSLLLSVIQTISCFARNQLTFELHRLCKGLSNEMVQCLRDFDRNNISPQYMPISGIDPVGVPIPANELSTKHVAAQMAPVIPTYTNPSNNKQDNSDVQENTNTPSPKLQLNITRSDTNQLQDIIDSYLNTQHVSADVGPTSSATTYTSNDENPLQSLMNKLDKETEQMLRFSPRRSPQLQSNVTSDSQYSQSPSPPPLSASSSTPVSPPTPRSVSPPSHFPFPRTISSSSSCYSTPSCHELDSGSTPSLAIQSHYPVNKQAQQYQEQSQESDLSTMLSTRDAEIATLRSQLRDLEIQNQLLNSNAKVLARQLDTLRVGLRESPSAGGRVGKFGFKKGLLASGKTNESDFIRTGGAVHIAHLSLNTNGLSGTGMAGRGVVRVNSKRKRVVLK